MKKIHFNIIIIIIIALFLTTLDMLNLLEKSGKFMLIPIFAFYIIGQYSERKFKK
ncbi:MAG: hypothetical protein IMY72_00340 [Bacteroidetes bacterium]|nr:hypothetical protein [Bacteroidota bacterium]